MTVREYIGARYVPLFSDPIEWDSTLVYEPLTVVKHLGASYVSKQSVPAGIGIDNENYWLLWADYNAQLEAYRNTVLTFDGRITANSDAIADFNKELGQYEENTNAEISAIKANNWVTTTRIADNAVTSAKIADGAVTTGDIANNAVTSAKIADGAVTSAKIADGAVTTGDIANNAVTSAKIADGTIDRADIKKRYMVVIGDSFSSEAQSGTPLWYTYVAKALNLNVWTNATDGMGYTVGQNNFSKQLDDAAAAVNSDQVDIVYILGGLNDTRYASYNANNFASAVGTVLNKALSLFPNSKIEVYGPQSFVNVNDNSGTASMWLAYQCAVRGIEYHDLTLTFNYFNNFFGGKTGTNEHPTATGERIMAACILAHGSLPFGTYVPGEQLAVAQKGRITRGSVSVDVNPNIVKEAGNVWHFYYTTPISQFVGGSGSFRVYLPNKARLLPQGFQSYNYFMGVAFVGAYESNTMYAGYARGNSDYVDFFIPNEAITAENTQNLVVKIDVYTN